ncbi:MAG: hypothetical protein R3Y54_13775, partial [Eubacteriales bacterium]
MKKLSIGSLIYLLLLVGCSADVPLEITSPLPIVESISRIPEENKLEPLEEASKITIEPIYYNHQELGGEFELPLQGACGFVGVSTNVRDEIGGNTLIILSPGQSFTIVEEMEEWWKILVEGTEGWVESKNCLINLPDVLPSIIYENPYANICTSCSLGREIPNVTGHRL